ncbi:MAG TPA: hypothetical protein P5150_05460 [Candidatus Ratteibacteria bacterium]|nr:hypothetical protein [Candidatus Ratteibacteria bacterium]
MSPIFGKIIAVILISLSIILLILSEIVFITNRKKGWISFVLSLVFTGISFYYFLLFFYQNIQCSSVSKKSINLPVVKVEEKITEDGKNIDIKPEETSLLVYIEMDGAILEATSEDEIEIPKETKFRITKVETEPERKHIKANFVGFVPESKNTTNDINFWISYKNIRKDKAIDKEKTKFELIIKSGNEILGKVYFKFI